MSYQLMSESFPKAARNHRCIWCGETIFKGQSYRREKSIFEGNWQDHCWHIECDNDAKDYFQSGADTFSAYGNERPVVGFGEQYAEEKMLDDRQRAKDINSCR